MHLFPVLRGGKSLRWSKWLLFAVTALVLAGVGFSWAVNHGYIGGVLAVVVDGNPIGYVASPDQVEQAVAFCSEQARAQCGLAVVVDSAVTTQRVAGRNHRALSQEELCAALQGRLRLSAEAWMVRVNGKDVVALASEEQARQVVEDVKAQYVRPSQESTLVEVRFLQGVEVAKGRVDPGRVRTPEEACRILLRGTDKLATYTVKRGDSLWRIAQATGLKVEDLQRANPGLARPDSLQVGQELTVVKAEPYVSVATTELQVLEVAIPRPVRVEFDADRWPWEEAIREPGRDGRKRLTYEIQRVDGVEKARSLVSEEILEEPVQRVIVRGSREAPSLGTGTFRWPVDGGGNITSGFGWRGRDYHPAIDIAAPIGTAVRAADSGVVTLAGWSAGYGRLVVINHGDGVSTRYAHLNSMTVREGQKVTKGEVIGTVGVSGRTTGPHLHFEVRVGGEARNPLTMYPGAGK